MRIIIIGGSGLIGSSLHNLLIKNEIEVISTYCKRKKPKMIKFNMLDQKISDVIPNISDKDIFLILSACSNPGWIFNNKELAYKTKVINNKILSIPRFLQLKHYKRKVGPNSYYGQKVKGK